MCATLKVWVQEDRMPNALAFFRGEIVPIADAKVGVMTHALHYGTTVFEGVRGNWNEAQGKLFIFRLREHYERLLRGCKIMMIDIPYSVDDLVKITVDLVQSCGYMEDLYIRPIAYKSEEAIANLMLNTLESDFALMAVPFGSYIKADGAIRCKTSSWRRPDDTMMPTGVKLTGLYTTSILAKTEAVVAGYHEAVLLNHDGTVSEGSGENLFLVQNGRISTPGETDNCLLGITRDSVIELAREELDIDVVERRIHRSELYLADEIFLTGTAAHVTPVGELDDRPIGDGETGPITASIQKIYRAVIRGDSPKYLDWCTGVAVKA
jgi:branched-chain amino acid aminotransferase